MKAVKSIAFCLIGIGLFFVIQYVLTPDWSTNDNMGHTIQGITDLEENSVDVFFLGTSHMEYGMSPMKLYEDRGIRSYSLATSSQSVSCSYFILKKGLEHQSPSVVVLDASGLFFGDSYDPMWRYVLDNLTLSPLKIEMAREYSKAVNSGSMLTALLPFFKYHTSWSELPEKISMIGKNEPYYSMGEFILKTYVMPNGLSTDAINAEEIDMLALGKGSADYYKDGTEGKRIIYRPAYEVKMEPSSVEWFYKIKQLCDEQGIKLVLTKVPVLISAATYTSAWTKTKSDLTRTFAEKNDVPFIDVLYDTDAGMDFLEDTIDYGAHLNIHGAEKVAVALGNYLVQDRQIVDRRNEQYDAALEKYKKVREVAFLELEMNFDRYLQRLTQGKDRWTILICARDDCMTCLNEEEYVALEGLGLCLIREVKPRDAYAAVLDRGERVYEERADRRITNSLHLGDISVEMTSSGWWTGPEASVMLNEKEIAINGRGLNIVVLDDETGCVIDSVCFDTFQDSKPAGRTWGNNYKYLCAYEEATCFA